MIEAELLPRLESWAGAGGMPGRGKTAASACNYLWLRWPRLERELVLQRYELLYEAGLIPEAARGSPPGTLRPGGAAGPCLDRPADDPRSPPDSGDGHRRLRAKIKYHPVVFELMPETLPSCSCSAVSKLWRDGWCTSRISAVLSNSRTSWRKPGNHSGYRRRPAKLFRFRREVLNQRAISEPNCPFQGLDKSYTQHQHMLVNTRLEYKKMALAVWKRSERKPSRGESLREGAPCDPGDRVAGPCARHRRHHDAEADP